MQRQPATTTTTSGGLLQPATTATTSGGLLQPATTTTTSGGLLQPATTATTSGGLLQPATTATTSGGLLQDLGPFYRAAELAIAASTPLPLVRRWSSNRRPLHRACTAPVEIEPKAAAPRMRCSCRDRTDGRCTAHALRV